MDIFMIQIVSRQGIGTRYQTGPEKNGSVAEASRKSLKAATSSQSRTLFQCYRSGTGMVRMDALWMNSNVS
jgi:hypothetical protein